MKEVCKRTIFAIGLLLLLTNGYGQWHLRHHYPIADYPTSPMRAVSGAIVVDCDIDSVYIECGSGVIRQNRIRLNNVEEEKMGPFCISTSEFSDSLDTWVTFLHSAENGHLQCDVRCFRSFYGTLPSFFTPDSCHCFSTHQQLSDTDTFILQVYSIVKDANVSTLQLRGKSLILDSLIGQTDKCGLFTLDIPMNQESYFGLFIDKNYICWVRILVTSDGFVPRFRTCSKIVRNTRKHQRRIMNYRKIRLDC